jgi:hypothetical protein
MIELEELHDQLKILRGDSLDSDEPDALIRVPLTPQPDLNSGAIALPEPTEK